jgi:predicted deacetylase
MKLAFRVDDVSPYMDWDRFRRLADIFNRHGVKPLLGVIPDNRDPALLKLPHNAGGWDELLALSEKGWPTAQHGYRHLYVTKNPGLLGINSYSEFAGLDLETQYVMLHNGKRSLEEHGLKSDIFMAPAHSFDRNTLRALRKLGFRTVTDGYSLFPYTRYGLKFIPCQSSQPRNLRAGVMTVCLHPNTMEEGEMESLDRWISGHRALVRDYAELLESRSLGAFSRAGEKVILLVRKLKKRSNREVPGNE